MTKHELVLDFCKQFRDLGAENCFSNGMCYWFADILRNRFNAEDVCVVYAPIDNHFACKINDRIYDVTGDVTDAYKWYNWQMYASTDASHFRVIFRDCIMKYPTDHRYCGACGKMYMDDWGSWICDCDNHPTGQNEQCVYEED